MSLEFILRIIGMVIFGLAGGSWGVYLARAAGESAQLYGVVMGLLGALVGLILTPFLTTRPIRTVRTALGQMNNRTLFSILTGLIVGLIIGALLSVPLAQLPDPLGQVMPIVSTLTCAYLGITLFAGRQEDFRTLFSGVFQPRPVPAAAPPEVVEQIVLLDTSVIIDGRIADIARTGFIPGTLVITRFVLQELQYIADSSDALRRQRGRRGLEVLTDLQKNKQVKVKISDQDISGNHPVDEKLVLLARQLTCPVLTNDYNLNRVAELQGVRILNINELANAVKVVFLPGEILNVQIIQEGKEHGQGVGYLEDGTMIVVENGQDYMGTKVPTVVTKVLQTAAGRMIFARPEGK
ncbi:MAG: PIN domain nuclease [Anaerolineales bacterium]|nr:PIN domain nuclease [Anaerolineales bacterium]